MAAAIVDQGRVFQRKTYPALFETRRQGRIRTMGTVMRVSHQNLERRDFPGDAVVRLYRQCEQHQPQVIAATGKVVVIAPDQHVVCFQVSGGAADRVACGNAWASAAAAMSQDEERDTIRFRAFTPDGDLTVVAKPQQCGERAWRVQQEWHLNDQCDLCQGEASGRRFAMVRLLNSYTIIHGHFPTYDDAVVFWRRVTAGRPEQNSLQARLAVIDTSSAGATAYFGGPNGRHPSAPQTGLATLAYAASRVPWVAAILGNEDVHHAAGQDPVPTVTQADGLLRFYLPEVEVRLRSI